MAKIEKHIIVDLDQTLCDSTDLIKKYLVKGHEDWEGYYKNLDKCRKNKFIEKLIIDYCKRIIFLTSRCESSKIVTLNWIRRNFCGICETELENDCFKLLMRPVGDRRPSAVVKKELYEKHIKGKYEIDCVIDDDLSVIEMFKKEGLNCLHVQTSVQYTD